MNNSFWRGAIIGLSKITVALDGVGWAQEKQSQGGGGG